MANAPGEGTGTLDELDRRLIGLLRRDARLSVATLAKKLQVARATVTSRMTRLQTQGVIVGYTLQLRPDAQPNEIRAWMGIAISGNEARTVIATMLGEPGVATLHDTNGRWDLLAELRAKDLSALSQVLERIRLIKGIQKSETSILMETYR